MQWLENSSYLAACTLCQQNLSIDHCIRLLCYHVFHWNCLNNYGESITSANQGSGDISVNCPSCNVPLAPPTDISSPLAEEIRKQLSTAQWCRANLSRSSPLPTSNNISNDIVIRNNISENGPKLSSQLAPAFHPLPQPPPVVIPFNHDNPLDCDEFINSVPNARKFFNGNHVFYDSHTNIRDVDEDKYRRRSMLETIYKWLR